MLLNKYPNMYTIALDTGNDTYAPITKPRHSLGNTLNSAVRQYEFKKATYENKLKKYKYIIYKPVEVKSFELFYEKGATKMRIDNSVIGMEAWITYVDGKPWDGPHRACSTNKANLCKWIKKQTRFIPDLDKMIIKKHIILAGKHNQPELVRITGEDYKLTTKDKKLYTLAKLEGMSHSIA